MSKFIANLKANILQGWLFSSTIKITQRSLSPSTKDMSYPGKEEIKHLNQLTDALFKAISFEEGSEPNISEIKDLFIENGLLINCNDEAPQPLPVGQFIAHFQLLYRHGQIASLHETEVHHKTKIYDHIAHRYSFYEARSNPDAEPFSKGINTLQFIKIRNEWKITSMAWNDDNRGDGFFERTMACINEN